MNTTHYKNINVCKFGDSNIKVFEEVDKTETQMCIYAATKKSKKK